MRNCILIFATASLVFLAGTASYASDSCNKSDLAKNVEYAVNLINTKGKACLPELKKHKFCSEAGYVFVVNMKGMNIMHPIQKLEGRDMSRLQGANGEYFGAEMIAKAEKYGKGWIAYTWENPASKKVEMKCTYIMTANMDGVRVFVGSGIFGINNGDCR